MPKEPCCCEDGEFLSYDRRCFFRQIAAIAGGGIALLVPTAAGVVTFLNPLRRKGQSGRWARVAMLDSLPADGTPQRAPVVADRTDAWTHFPAEPVGAVFLRRTGRDVTALQAACPHAECPLSYDQQGKFYICPCHQHPRFDLSGKRIEGEKSYSPRDMDSLKVEIRNRNEVWVKL